MVRPNGIVLAIALAVVGIIGFGMHATGWLVTLDLCAAVIACALASTVPDETDAALAMISMSGVTLVLAGVALANDDTTTWLAWATLAIAVGFLAVGIVAAVRATHDVETRRPAT